MTDEGFFFRAIKSANGWFAFETDRGANYLDLAKMFLWRFKTGERFEILFRRIRKSNSLSQLGYYHAVIVPYSARAMGVSEKMAEKILDDMFFYEYVTVLGIGEVKIHRSKKIGNYSTVEFENIFQQIREWLFDFYDGYICPLPGEVEF